MTQNQGCSVSSFDIQFGLDLYQLFVECLNPNNLDLDLALCWSINCSAQFLIDDILIPNPEYCEKKYYQGTQEQ